ncbi:hypothetical protein HK101_004904 [Irineochytrium annulatum]|nr:hypothetical protein HK101_004904 [Irineochytrium annulatum]
MATATLLAGIAASALAQLPATPPQTCTDSQNSVMYPGFDINNPASQPWLNFNLSTVAAFTVNAPCDCAAKCSATAGCDFFTVYGNLCQLKATIGTWAPNAKTWFREAQASFTYDLPSYDISGKMFTNVASESACHTLCLQNSPCLFSAYEADKSCWLKTPIAAPATTILGYPTGPSTAPPPTSCPDTLKSALVPGRSVSNPPAENWLNFNLAGYPAFAVASPCDCATKCSATTGCNFFSVIGGMCQLQATIGTWAPTQTVWFVKAAQSTKFDLPDFDVSNAPAASEAACHAQCQANSACVMSSYGPSGTCWLKAPAKTAAGDFFGYPTISGSTPPPPVTSCSDTGKSALVVGAGIANPSDMPWLDFRMPNQAPFAVTNACDCAAKCSSTPGCAFFTVTSGQCQLQVTLGTWAPQQTVWFVKAAAATKFDLPDFDLANAPAASEAACHAQCQANPACVFSSYGPSGQCYLKAPQANAAMTFGYPTVSATPPPPATTCTDAGKSQLVIGAGIANPSDMPWLDFNMAGQAPFAVASACDCAAKCSATVGCAFFTVTSGQCQLQTTIGTWAPTQTVWFVKAAQSTKWDLPDFDLANAPAASEAACHAQCQGNAACVMSSYGPSGQCYLKAPQANAAMTFGYPTVSSGPAIPAGWFTIKNPDGTCWTASGTSVITAACVASNQAQWWSYALGHLVSKFTGSALCPTAPDNSVNTNKALSLQTCWGAASQLLTLSAPNSATQQLRIASDGYCLSGSKGGVVSQVSSGCDTFTFSDHSVISPPPQPACSSVTTRMEWRDMSAAQRSDYIKAVQGLRNTPSLAGRRSYYDDLIAMHAAAVGMIHGSALFLPWHRQYMQLYENALRTVVPGVVVPFWDWGYDGYYPLMSSTVSQILGADQVSHFGTRGNPVINDGFCHDWTRWQDGQHLGRMYSNSGTGFYVDRGTTIYAFVIGNTDFPTFANNLEGVHNTFHSNIGGLSNGNWGDMYDPTISPNDPIFFLHHANIDRIWGMWQQQHPNVASQFSGTTTPGCPSGQCSSVPVTSSYLLPNFNIPVSQALLLGQNQLCAAYGSFSLDTATSFPVTARRRRSADAVPPPSYAADGIPYGSGNHGTVPAPAAPPVDITFLKLMHPLSLFNSTREPTDAEVADMVAMYTQQRAVLQGYQDAIHTAMDEYLAQNPGQYDAAVHYGIHNADIAAVDAAAPTMTAPAGVAYVTSAPSRAPCANGHRAPRK